jgi:phage gp37-like protein
MYTIEQIEDAIIAKLAPLKVGYTPVDESDPAVWRTVKTIKSYQGELDDEESLARAVRLFPAIIVMYGGSDYDEHGARKIEKPAFVLFVCDKSLRAEEEARRGGSQNPGAYALLNGIRDLLYDSRLSKDIFPLSLLRERPAWFGKGIAIYSAEYETAQALLYVGD